MKRYLVIFIILLSIINVGCFNKDNKKESETEISAWPNINNTGIPSGTPKLTVITKTMKTEYAGQIIDAINLMGRLYVEHPNVVIRRSKLSGDIYYAVYCTTSGTALTIEDCDITSGVKMADGFTGRRNHLHGGENRTFDDGWSVYASNILLEDNLIDGMIGGEGAHLDGIQVMGGNNITIRHNWIEAVSPPIIGGGVNAAIMIAPDLSEINNVFVENNMLIEKEGYYPLRINARGKVQVTGNRFRKGHLGIPCHLSTTVLTKWEDNAYDDGEVISEPTAVKLVTSVKMAVLDNIKVGESITASAITTYSDGTSDNSVERWSTSDEGKATINRSGIIVAKSMGSVTISALRGGKIGEKSINVIEATIKNEKRLTIGVWMQSPTRERNGIPNVVNYKNIGINAFVGLWLWPTENWAYNGYTMKTAKSLKDNGMKVYSGKDQAAVEWNRAHPEYADTFVGYMLGDEADMFKVNYVSTDPISVEKWSWALPDNWKTSGEAIRVQDPVREIYANFGKPFAGGFYKPMPGSTKELDFGKYVSPTSVYSCDFYGMTDPYEARKNHGIWTYGRAVKNAVKYSEGRPVWGFVEVSSPWKLSNAERQLAKEMKAEWVKPIVWNMIISGAKGIVYFCHNFLPEKTGGEAACFDEPGMPDAMTDANASIQKYADVILSEVVSGTSVTTTGAVDVITLTKKYNGNIYIFAMGNGNAENIEGAEVTAVINVQGMTDGRITVEDENREIVMKNGSFTDKFNPYEVHIYKISK